jgi:hypothetical protein
MVVFTRVFDLLAWLMPKTESFPKGYRHTVTARLAGAALDLLEQLVEAQGRRGAARRARLQDADTSLDKLRIYLRLAHEWQWLSHGQYEHVSRIVAEIGRLVGGWMRQTSQAGGQSAADAGSSLP